MNYWLCPDILGMWYILFIWDKHWGNDWFSVWLRAYSGIWQRMCWPQDSYVQRHVPRIDRLICAVNVVSKSPAHRLCNVRGSYIQKRTQNPPRTLNLFTFIPLQSTPCTPHLLNFLYLLLDNPNLIRSSSNFISTLIACICTYLQIYIFDLSSLSTLHSSSLPPT